MFVIQAGLLECVCNVFWPLVLVQSNQWEQASCGRSQSFIQLSSIWCLMISIKSEILIMFFCCRFLSNHYLREEVAVHTHVVEQTVEWYASQFCFTFVIYHKRHCFILAGLLAVLCSAWGNIHLSLLLKDRGPVRYLGIFQQRASHMLARSVQFFYSGICDSLSNLYEKLSAVAGLLELPWR